MVRWGVIQLEIVRLVPAAIPATLGPSADNGVHQLMVECRCSRVRRERRNRRRVRHRVAMRFADRPHVDPRHRGIDGRCGMRHVEGIESGRRHWSTR